VWYVDDDEDGHGDPSSSLIACDGPSKYALLSDDCNDDEGAAYPGAAEICDDVDNDCDGFIDVNAEDAPTWYRDEDSDDYGNPLNTQEACLEPTGYADNNEDCDDSTATAFPENDEVCDEADNDCDGDAD
jgi:hypothetical protein